ncbi:MAG: guanylate kinase [Chitinophagales bacterium]|nr:guanylate kinase [Chitinophagales bacterium]
MKKKSILITAPSGAGKTTLVKKLLQDFPHLEFSISATTREPREHEKDGIDYHFITETEFKHKIENQEFIEWEEVYKGSFYGTPKSEIDRIYGLGKIPIFDIDIMGAMSVKKLLCNDILSIFIAAPSLQILEERLRKRHTETEEKIQTRLNKAISEMKFANFFDKKIINDELEVAYAELKGLVDKYLSA